MKLHGYTVGLSLAALSVATICFADVRLRDVIYSVDEVYRLPAYAGYDTDIEFQSGERFVGLGSGDLQGLSFHVNDNHLFISRERQNVHTDITVLTDRRVYHFEYVTTAQSPDASHADLLYALRFLYPQSPPPPQRNDGVGLRDKSRLEELLKGASVQRPTNLDYWYCGSPQLRPIAAWDDGIQTHLRFRVGQEMPALFLSNEDGSESLLNFHIEADDVVIHRVIRRLVLRRGGLRGCVVNRGLVTTPLRAGTTISPVVSRDLRERADE